MSMRKMREKQKQKKAKETGASEEIQKGGRIKEWE